MAAYPNAPPPSYPGGGGSNPPFAPPVSKVEMKISCRNLVDMDVFSKSDPFVVVSMQAQNSDEWREIGRTEVIWDNLNPDFVKSFIIDYFFEEQQHLKFEVYDMDNESSRNIKDQDFIGKLVTSVGSIVGENGGKLEHPLQVPTAKDKERNDNFSRKSPGTIIVRAEEVSGNKDVLNLSLCGVKLDKKDWFGKSDPYLEFQRCNEDNSYTTVYRTEEHDKRSFHLSTLIWKPLPLVIRDLSNAGYDSVMVPLFVLLGVVMAYIVLYTTLFMDIFSTAIVVIVVQIIGIIGYSVVHRTEVIKSTLNPVWKPFTVPVQTLCNGDLDRNMKIYCYDWNSNGTADLIGFFEATVRDFIDYRNGRPSSYEIFGVDKKGKKKSKKSGTIHIQECIQSVKYSFLDYISGGLELNFVVAIDFTASNGEPSSPQSLHYSSPQVPSQYVQVLQAIGGIIEDYDADKLFPSFGFGARLPPSWNVSHEFALNFNPNDPNCQGVDGIISAYYHSITNVQLYGPTNFSPVINGCSRIARGTDPGSQYFVLLIITDGIISDMQKTKQAIIEAAVLPISIIIVGVGPADFDAMEELDGDEVRVNVNGSEAERDIVQFVPFRDYMHASGVYYNPAHGVRLAKDVLHELPDQLVEFMEKKKIKPNRQLPS